MYLTQSNFTQSECFHLKGDEWRMANDISIDTDDYKDSSWSGCDFRYETDVYPYYKMACDIEITGRKSIHEWRLDRYKTRVRIIMIGDGEPNHSFLGAIYSKRPIIQ